MSLDIVVAQKERYEGTHSGKALAAAITLGTAWALRAEGWGLVHKSPAQNGFDHGDERYAIDVVMNREGAWADILVNSETENRPAWQLHSADDNSPGVANWRPAVAPPDVEVPNEPEDPDTPEEPLDGLFEELAALLARIAADVADIKAKQAKGYVGKNRFLGTIEILPKE